MRRELEQQAQGGDTREERNVARIRIKQHAGEPRDTRVARKRHTVRGVKKHEARIKTVRARTHTGRRES